MLQLLLFLFLSISLPSAAAVTNWLIGAQVHLVVFTLLLLLLSVTTQSLCKGAIMAHNSNGNTNFLQQCNMVSNGGCATKLLLLLICEE